MSCLSPNSCSAAAHLPCLRGPAIITLSCMALVSAKDLAFKCKCNHCMACVTASLTNFKMTFARSTHTSTMSCNSANHDHDLQMHAYYCQANDAHLLMHVCGCLLHKNQNKFHDTSNLSLVATAVSATPSLLEFAALRSDIWLGV